MTVKIFNGRMYKPYRPKRDRLKQLIIAIMILLWAWGLYLHIMRMLKN